jgi:hypothetical protein
MNGHPPLTWGDVKRWAEANGVTDDAVMADDSLASPSAQKFRDLSFEPAEDNYHAEFVLQHRWG